MGLPSASRDTGHNPLAGSVQIPGRRNSLTKDRACRNPLEVADVPMFFVHIGIRVPQSPRRVWRKMQRKPSLAIPASSRNPLTEGYLQLRLESACESQSPYRVKWLPKVSAGIRHGPHPDIAIPSQGQLTLVARRTLIQLRYGSWQLVAIPSQSQLTIVTPQSAHIRAGDNALVAIPRGARSTTSLPVLCRNPRAGLTIVGVFVDVQNTLLS